MKYMLIHCIDEAAERDGGTKHPTARHGTVEVRPVAGSHCGDAGLG